MTDTDLNELKREIEYSKQTGAIKVKSNCGFCYETGIEGFRQGEPVLCRCMKIDSELLLKQNANKLAQ